MPSTRRLSWWLWKRSGFNDQLEWNVQLQGQAWFPKKSTWYLHNLAALRYLRRKWDLSQKPVGWWFPGGNTTQYSPIYSGLWEPCFFKQLEKQLQFPPKPPSQTTTPSQDSDPSVMMSFSMEGGEESKLRPKTAHFKAAVQELKKSRWGPSLKIRYHQDY